MISRFTNPRNIRLVTKCLSTASYSTKNPLSPNDEFQQLFGGANKIKQSVEAKQELAPYPDIEGVKFLDLENYRPSNFKTVKYGEHEFIECNKGFVHITVKGKCDERDPSNPRGGYGVFYGINNHPLNTHGPIFPGDISKITPRNTSIFALVQAFKTMPTKLFTKVCICTDESFVINMMTYWMPLWIANNFRTLQEPSRRLQNLDSVKFLNEFVRVNPLTYKFLYTPNDCYIFGMLWAEDLAEEGMLEFPTNKKM